MKVCSRCKEEKELTEFYKNYKKSGGLSGLCKTCQIWYNHGANLKLQFGISQKEYEAKVEAQGGVCFLCGKPDQRGWRLTQDHDHETNQLRNLLCMHCNIGLGAFHDDPELMIKAAEYIKAWKDKHGKEKP